MTRVCLVCQIEYKANKVYQKYCKKCVGSAYNTKVREWYKKNNTRILQQRKIHHETIREKLYLVKALNGIKRRGKNKIHSVDKAKRNQISKKYYENNKHKAYARNVVNKAIRSGKLVKPSKCTECDNPLKLEAHHPDHREPLNILWLCKKCHMKKHHKLNEENLRERLRVENRARAEELKLIK